MPRHVALVDDCQVEDIPSQWKIEVFCGPGLKRARLHGREIVDGDGDGKEGVVSCSC